LASLATLSIYHDGAFHFCHFYPVINALILKLAAKVRISEQNTKFIWSFSSENTEDVNLRHLKK